jgi:hypothetical protein
VGLLRDPKNYKRSPILVLTDLCSTVITRQPPKQHLPRTGKKFSILETSIKHFIALCPYYIIAVDIEYLLQKAQSGT